MSAPLLAVEGLAKHFGGNRALFARTPLVRAVDGVSFAVAKGETFAIVGESGCGKSTIARLVMRLLEPTAGKILFEGQDITGLSSDAMRPMRRRMQMVFQDPYASLNPRMTIKTIVGEPIWLKGDLSSAERNERVADILTQVGLSPALAKRYPHEFSGGQRQRIGIARALASNPVLLIGDEPVSALDVSIQAQIINLLEELKARLGLTMVIISHDLAVVRHVSDRVAVMYLGEIVESAPVDALFEMPLHPYTQALLAAIPVTDPANRKSVPILEGDLPSSTALPPGCRFHTRCPHVIARCKVEPPKLASAGDGRLVACHRAFDLPNAGTSAMLGTARGATREKRIALFRRAVSKRSTGLPSPTGEPR